MKTLKLKLISNSCLQPNMVCSDKHTSESFGYHSVLGPFNSHTLRVPTLQVRTNETWCVLSATQCAIVCGEWGNSISWSTPEQSDLWKLMFQVCLQLLARQGNSPPYITARKWVHTHYTAVVEVHMHIHLVVSCDFRPNVWMYGLETTNLKDLISGLGLFMLFSEVTNSLVLKLINL